MTQQERDYLRRLVEQGRAADMNIALSWNVVLALLDSIDRAEIARAAAIQRGAADHAVAEAARAEIERARAVAADLIEQYMQFPEGYIGHEFMSAQEDAIEYFEDIGWLRAEPLERYWWTQQSGRAKADTVRATQTSIADAETALLAAVAGAEQGVSDHGSH